MNFVHMNFSKHFDKVHHERLVWKFRSHGIQIGYIAKHKVLEELGGSGSIFGGNGQAPYRVRTHLQK